MKQKARLCILDTVFCQKKVKLFGHAGLFLELIGNGQYT